MTLGSACRPLSRVPESAIVLLGPPRISAPQQLTQVLQGTETIAQIISRGWREYEGSVLQAVHPTQGCMHLVIRRFIWGEHAATSDKLSISVLEAAHLLHRTRGTRASLGRAGELPWRGKGGSHPGDKPSAREWIVVSLFMRVMREKRSCFDSPYADK